MRPNLRWRQARECSERLQRGELRIGADRPAQVGMGVERSDDLRIAVAVAAAPVRHGFTLQPIDRREQEADACTVELAIIELLASDNAGGEAVAARGGARDAQCHDVGNGRPVDCAFHLVERVVAAADIDIAFIAVDRLLWLEQYRAACCIAPEESALRSLQDLNTGQVEERARTGRIARHLGEVSGRARLVMLPHLHQHACATHEEFRVIAVLAADVHAGGDGTQILDGCQALLLQLRPADRSDGDRHVLEALLAPPGGHHDLIEGDVLVPGRSLRQPYGLRRLLGLRCSGQNVPERDERSHQ
jgi:hypothetical protein